MVELFDIESNKKVIKIGKEQYTKSNIVFYGDDNRYPNIFESLIDSSQTANICVKTQASFLATNFVNEDLEDIVVGHTATNKKYTLGKFKRDLAQSLSKFNGAYVAVTKNLKNQVVSVSVLDFTKVRFGEFDDLGRSNFAFVGDWNGEIIGKPGKKKFKKFPLFNNNNEVFQKQAELCGTTVQVYHIFIDETYIYPVNPFECVAMDMDTESCIQETRHNEMTQGSPSKLIIRTDLSEDKKLHQEQIEQIKRFAGPYGDKVLVIKTEFDEDGNPRSNGYKVDVISDTRDLSKFDSCETAISNNIRKCMNIPGILVDYESATGINVSGEQIKTSVNYYNDLVRNKRKMISEAMSEIFEQTAIEFPTKDFSLTDFSMTYE